jgi:flagellar FliL protein
MKSKLKILLPIVLLAAGGAYKFALAKPAPGPPPKVHGDVYVLPKDFLVNLKGGRYAKLGVALVVKAGSAAPAGGHAETPVTPPDGYGTLPQEALVRAIVTDTLTDATEQQLVSWGAREKLTRLILKRIQRHTDVKAEDVVLTDVAVQ